MKKEMNRGNDIYPVSFVKATALQQLFMLHLMAADII